ncbi:Bud site selection protein, Revert to axial protein 1 [Taxawa tesnikishii (nom. ined.)]|nr:Bud site selection protein, Revert to axial protein 1 [Dothideales sp. JES 119]
MGSRPVTPDETRNRLPNLWEVLSRRTKAPVDLFSFYIYMRDTQRSVDYLDFWLDVSQHMSLCRHYVRGLRSSALIPTPELEKSNSKRSSAVLEGMGETRNDSTAGPSTFERKITPDQRLSAFLRNDNGSKYSPSGSHASDRSNDNTPGSERPPRPSFMATPSNDNSPGAVSSGSPSSTVARVDIRASAEKILYTYLLQGSEREIILPVGILENITTAIEQEGRDDPEVFDAAKDYVFQAMERDAFPGFLRAKALGNIVQPSMMLRLIVGLVSLFGALWTAFVLIFLDYSRATRCWLILPFTIAVYFLTSHQYMLDPILAMAGFSENTLMNFTRIKEPYIRTLLNKRAMMCLWWIIIIDAALCCLFILVPGKRL